MQQENTAHDNGQNSSKIHEILRKKAQDDLDAESHEIPASNPLETVCVGGLAFLALALCSYNVIARHFFPAYILDFIEEFQVYFVVWAVFLSLGTLTLTDRHVKSDFFVAMFPEGMKRAVAWLADILGLIFSIGMVYYGFEVAYQAYDFGDVSTTMMRTPLWIYFAALPAGGAVMGLAYVIRIKRKLVG